MHFAARSLTFAVLALALPLVLAAQDSVAVAGPGSPMATRSDLEAELGSAEGDRRAAIQLRLEEGDFRPGDLVALSVVNEEPLTDTFTVRTGRTILLPNIGELSLRGVLRSELRSHMQTELARYIRNPQVDATALVRVAVTGAVGSPGFYNVPAEMPASQVLMVAGGPGGRGDINKVELRRGQATVIDRDSMQTAFAANTSLDQLDVHGGDQFFVGERSQGFRGLLGTIGLITGVFTGIYFATRIF